MASRRETAHWTRHRVGGTVWKRCGRCQHCNLMKRRVCQGCGRQLVRRPRAKRPARGTDERVRQDLKVAAKMADLWAAKARRAALLLHHWNRRERALAARLLAGPPPKREKKAKPRRRAIDVAALAPAAVQP